MQERFIPNDISYVCLNEIERNHATCLTGKLSSLTESFNVSYFSEQKQIFDAQINFNWSLTGFFLSVTFSFFKLEPRKPALIEG